MKILVNCSTLVSGGGIQVGLGFIKASRSFPAEHEFFYLVSKPIYRNLPKEIRESNRIIIVDKSPGSIAGWMSFISVAREAYKYFKPDLVYSVGYPSYYKFCCPEIGRYTNPWEFFPEPLPWGTIRPPVKRLLFHVACAIRRVFAKSAIHIETQTTFAKHSISNKLNMSLDRISVIPNSISQEFYELHEMLSIGSLVDKSLCDNVYAFCLAADHPHKNLNIIPQVCASILRKYHLRITFILTIPIDSNTWLTISRDAQSLGVSELIVNKGPLTTSECIAHYKSSTFVFLPTLLEVFSATYLEAMSMGVPIVTSDRMFARDICHDAAVYVDPCNVHDISNKIHRLITTPAEFRRCVVVGRELFSKHPTPQEKIKIIYRMFQSVTIKSDNPEIT